MDDLNSLDGRKTFVLQIQRMAMKARSDMTESLGNGNVAQSVLADLQPYLFGEINVVDVAERILKADHFSNGDIMNLLVLCEKTPAMQVMYTLFNHGEELPAPMDFMRNATLRIV